MSDPLNVKLLSIDEIIKSENIQQVTSNFIKAPSSTSFHPNGLFSETIFGQIASDRRLVSFGYIDLGTKVFHPKVYKNLLQLKRFYGEIISGREYALFDNEIEDFIKASEDTPNADTGFLFFLKNYDKIKFTMTNSLDRNDKVEILTKYKDNLLVDKWLVIPAGIRDIRVEDSGQSTEDINKFYSSLINLSKAIPEQGKDNPIYNNIRFSIQKKIVEIFTYIENILSGKKGFLQKKYGARNLALGTRNVVASANFAVSDIKSDQFLKVDESLIGVFQTVKCFQPAIVYQLKTLFFDHVFDGSSNQISVIDKDTYNLTYTPITETEKDKFLSSSGIADLLNLCKSPQFRSTPLVVQGDDDKQYYLFMVYDTGEEIYYYRSKADFISFYEQSGKEYDSSLSRPLTYIELLYVCCWITTRDKHLLITRYPVMGMDSIYPSTVHVASTTPARSIQLKVVFDNSISAILPEYPILGNRSLDSFVVHPSKYAGLNAD